MKNRNELQHRSLSSFIYRIVVSAIVVMVLAASGCQIARPARAILPPPPPHHGAMRPVQLALPQISSNRISMHDLNDQEQLPSLVGDQGTVLLDFYADWCAPCRKQGEVLDAVASQNVADARIVKVNVDRHANLAQEFQVDGLPTILLFRNGEFVNRKTGFADAAELARLLQN